VPVFLSIRLSQNRMLQIDAPTPCRKFLATPLLPKPCHGTLRLWRRGCYPHSGLVLSTGKRRRPYLRQLRRIGTQLLSAVSQLRRTAFLQRRVRFDRVHGLRLRPVSPVFESIWSRDAFEVLHVHRGPVRKIVRCLRADGRHGSGWNHRHRLPLRTV